MRNYARTYKGICCYNLVYNFLIQLLSLKSSAFVVYFLNTFWHENEAFPKGSSKNEIVLLLVIFHLTYSKYKGVKICFQSFSYQNQNFSLVLHSCRSCSTRVALVSLVSYRVSFVSLVSHSCRIRVARVWHSCCKLDQIVYTCQTRFHEKISFIQIRLGFHALFTELLLIMKSLNALKILQTMLPKIHVILGEVFMNLFFKILIKTSGVVWSHLAPFQYCLNYIGKVKYKTLRNS